jgi:hypothetical protein
MPPRADRRRGLRTTRNSVVDSLRAALAVAFALRFASWAEQRRGGARLDVVPDARTPADDEGAARSEGGDARAGIEVETKDETENARAGSRGRVPLRRRFAASLAFAIIFFAGAALAALGGNAVSSLTAGGQVPPTTCVDAAAAPGEEDIPPPEGSEACSPTTTGDTTTEEGTTEEEPQAEAPSESTEPGLTTPTEPGLTTPTEPGLTSPPEEQAPPAPPTDEPGDLAPAAPGAAPEDAPSESRNAGGGRGESHEQSPSAPPLVEATRPEGAPTRVDPEARAFESATLWLHRALPDPTPPARRLAPGFARKLKVISWRHAVSWALVLGVLRAEGHSGRVPASTETLRRVASRLADLRRGLRTRRPWPVALAYSGRTSFADRAVALARYNRAVGLTGLVVGLERAKPALIERVIDDGRIELYAGGRSDIEAGRIDVRVLVLLRYLRLAHGGVTVSSLVSGHRVFARPGVVSAHVFGLAVDISALGGVSISGNQEPRGLTERAVRNILLLPDELAPQQVISLLGLGGPSFPLADHDDHIHVGY